MRRFSFGLAAAAVLFPVCATAADPALTCQTSKLKIAGKYGACRLNAEAKGEKLLMSPDFSKCAATYADKWSKAETKASGACIVDLDQADIENRIIADTADLATLLSGGAVPECGDGVQEGSEQCDGADLDGQTCVTLGYASGGTIGCDAGCGFNTSDCDVQGSNATGQTTSFGAGDDGAVQAGATMAFTDNGDGTITDANTGLMWEKKIGFDVTFGSVVNCATEAGTCANPHHASNRYTWTTAMTPYDGTVVTIFLEQLNDRCNNDVSVACSADADCLVPGGPCGFAGHRDWRLANKKEFDAILDLGTVSPAVPAAFDGVSCGPACTDLTDPACSCTTQDYNWSSTTYFDDSRYAWVVEDSAGFATAFFKTTYQGARAVRAGL